MAEISLAGAPKDWAASPAMERSYREQGGAAWARAYLERVRKEPDKWSLAYYVDGARNVIFKDDPDQQDAFFNTLRDAIVGPPADSEPRTQNDSASKRVDIEEATALVKQAEAVATLVHCDEIFDEQVAKQACGAVSTCLHAALDILEPKETQETA